MNVKERNELLIRLDERVAKIDKCLSNHLHFHSKLSLALVVVALTTIATLLVTLIRY